jgi:RHH-type rel operon transcriptional repressor/antitoxin RelB
MLRRIIMTVSVRMNDSDMEIIKAYAELNRLSVSEIIRRSVMEHIEDEFDLKSYNEAMEEYKSNPVTYSLEEVIEELDLS